MTPAEPARIHLLPARDAPYVVIVRRKPSRWFHVLRLNTKTNEIEHGSWFAGKLYPMRCDVSFDGVWMVYLAMGSNGETWNGVCRAPFLRTVAQGSNMGTWFGGGYWPHRKTLLLNQWEPSQGKIPFRTGPLAAEFGGEDLSVLYPRLARDGWKRCGDDYGESRMLTDAARYAVECVDDEGWRNRPGRKHPALHVRYAGYLRHGYTFRFRLEEEPGLIDDEVDWACWDSRGDLLFSRRGVVYKYSLDDLSKGVPGKVFDLEPLEPPRD